MFPAQLGEGGPSVRVFGVRRGSLPHQAGLENGDVVIAIDGEPPTSERGLDAYARALRGGPVRITVRRRGSELDLRYELAP